VIPSNPRSPTPAALVAFVRAAELGSFAAAARHLDISPAAVGQAVTRLENAFGVKLLARTTRRMTLTMDGATLLARCRGVVAELDAIARVFEETRGVVSGHLRISAPLGLGRRRVVPLVARFLAAHPAVEVTLDCSDTIRDFADDPVDLTFRILRPTDSTIVARRISRLQAVTCASPRYLDEHGIPQRPHDIERGRHSCIAYRHPSSGRLEPMTFRVGHRDVTLAPRHRLVVNDVEAACEAGAEGVGIVQPPSDYVAPYLASGRLVRILDAYTASPWTLYLCYAAAKRLPRRVRAFVEFARAELGRDRFVVGA
jgi:DNA-binding transcriptional LysR family regulator